MLRANLTRGHSGADRIVEALTGFRAEQGRYPDTLAEIVPAHIEELPTSGYRLMGTEYRYLVGDGLEGEVLLLWRVGFANTMCSHNLTTGTRGCVD